MSLLLKHNVCDTTQQEKWRKLSNGFRLFTCNKFDAKIINMIV